MSQIQYVSHKNKFGKRFWKQVKVVTTRKEHPCDSCGEIIPKNTQCLTESGFSEHEGFFNCYFHLDKQHDCHLDYLDCVQPDFDVRDKILAAVNRS